MRGLLATALTILSACGVGFSAADGDSSANPSSGGHAAVQSGSSSVSGGASSVGGSGAASGSVGGSGAGAPASSSSGGVGGFTADGGGGQGGMQNGPPGWCVTTGGSIQCNPVTLAGCGGSQSCDSTASGFSCFGQGNVTPVCQVATPEQNQFCQIGYNNLPAYGNICRQPCCDDVDCDSGTCEKAAQLSFVPALGFCTCP
jgi:hypothetical protein